MKKLRTLTVALVTALAFSPIAPASAEGSFTTHMDQVRNGFGTRIWNDKNLDSHNTVIVASKCKNLTPNSPGRVDFTLRRYRPGLPDPILGAKPFSACYRGIATGSWGRVSAGRYYAAIGTHDWNHVTVGHLKVSY